MGQRIIKCIRISVLLKRNFDVKDLELRHHCISFQAAITMIMDNLDDSSNLTKLLQKVGAHHFFYDAIESHLEVIFLVATLVYLFFFANE